MKTNGKTSDGLTGEAFAELKEAGKDILEEASSILKKKTAGLREKGLKETIKEHPIASILVALGLGVLLVVLFRRKK